MRRLGLQAKGFFIQGEHDDIQNWTEDREGSSLLNSDTASGRPDLHPWLHDRRVDYEGLLSRYSGEGLADAERAVADTGRLQEEACRQTDPAEVIFTEEAFVDAIHGLVQAERGTLEIASHCGRAS